MSHCAAEPPLTETASAEICRDREWLERYSRQLLLPAVGGRGQRLLHQATVAVGGCGTSGTPLALYLAGAGVGRLLLMDSGAQANHLASAIQDLNPLVQTVVLPPPASWQEAAILLPDCQVAIAADGQATLRQQLNRAAIAAGCLLLAGWQTPSAAVLAASSAGLHPAAPCLHCCEQILLHQSREAAAPPLLMQMTHGLIGSILAMETIAILLNKPCQLFAHCYLFHPEQSNYQLLPVSKWSHCPVCASDARVGSLS
ncbi:MAG: hypothetical protein HQM06_06180 [Magnetococcales bacterium]|nr:hypothetical protein [Magnetococcales bacterium]